MNGKVNGNVINSWKLLRFTYGFLGIIAGADKFFDIIVNWSRYVNPLIFQVSPLSSIHFMYAVGIVEIIVGILILSRYCKLGAYIIAAWLLIIAVNLISIGSYDIAVRDVVMAVGAIVLAWLTIAVKSNNKNNNNK